VCCSVLQCANFFIGRLAAMSSSVAVCRSVLQCVAVCCSVSQCDGLFIKWLATMSRGVGGCWRVLEGVARMLQECCRTLRGVAACYDFSKGLTSMSRSVTMWCRVLQYAECCKECRVLQGGARCCMVLHGVTISLKGSPR